MARYILRFHPTIKEESLLNAIRGHCPTLVKTLLEGGAPVDSERGTALLFSLKFYVIDIALEMTQHLINHCPEIKKHGAKALMESENPHPRLMRLFVQNGAPISDDFFFFVENAGANMPEEVLFHLKFSKDPGLLLNLYPVAPSLATELLEHYRNPPEEDNRDYQIIPYADLLLRKGTEWIVRGAMTSFRYLQVKRNTLQKSGPSSRKTCTMRPMSY